MSPRRAAAPSELRVTAGERLVLPGECRELLVRSGRRGVKLTNLDKVFFPEAGITKRQLLQYYADVAPALLPHLKGRAMVMKRYPNGIHGKFFFMKRTPAGAPAWLKCCKIEHASGSVIDFPIVEDLISLLWIVNLGCVDLNPWYARCDDIDRPDFLHFDLDPVPPAPFEPVVLQ
jgi:bifunctional non-homologous end joining protein LigD